MQHFGFGVKNDEDVSGLLSNWRFRQRQMSTGVKRQAGGEEEETKSLNHHIGLCFKGLQLISRACSETWLLPQGLVRAWLPSL